MMGKMFGTKNVSSHSSSSSLKNIPDPFETPCISYFIAEESLVLQNEEGPVINPGDVLISGSADSTARSWSFDTGGCLKIFKGHSGAVTTMATDALGKILYSAGADALIKSWNISTGQCLKVSITYLRKAKFYTKKNLPDT